MQEMQKEYDSENKRLSEQVEKLTKRNNELELELKMMESDYRKEVGQLSEKVADLDDIRK